MKKLLNTILSIIIILIIAGVVLTPQQASADWASDLSCLFNPGRCVTNASLSILNSLFASLGNLILTFTSYILSISAIILNISIILTMNIKAIYEATPAINEVWIVIRNISSMFIIFGLLYTSIMTILDINKPNIKGLIVNIIMAGLLINFSLFFTKVLIDASNLVSLSLYRAIAPNAQIVNLTKEALEAIAKYPGFFRGALEDMLGQEKISDVEKSNALIMALKQLEIEFLQLYLH